MHTQTQDGRHITGYHTTVFNSKKSYEGPVDDSVLSKTDQIRQALENTNEFSISFEGVELAANGTILAKRIC